MRLYFRKLEKKRSIKKITVYNNIVYNLLIGGRKLRVRYLHL